MTGIKVSFQPASSAAWNALKTSAGVAAAVRATAEAGKAHAESISPVVSGAYRDAFTVSSGVEGGRAVSWLSNESDYAASVEWKQDRHILAKTADAIESGAV